MVDGRYSCFRCFERSARKSIPRLKMYSSIEGYGEGAVGGKYEYICFRAYSISYQSSVGFFRPYTLII